MKFYVVLMFLLVSLFSKAQSDSVKSLVVQRVDQVSLNRIEEIETNLTKFHNANRTSQILLFVGSALTVGSALFNLSNPDSPSTTLPIIGGLTSIVGGVFYLDSYKYLNFSKKKKKSLSSQNDYYNF